jgi:hypothetical protein
MTSRKIALNKKNIIDHIRKYRPHMRISTRTLQMTEARKKANNLIAVETAHLYWRRRWKYSLKKSDITAIN